MLKLKSIDVHDLPALPAGSVIKAETLEAVTLARAIETRARSAAAAQLRRARARAESIVAASRPAGLAEGLEKFIAAEERLNKEREQLSGTLKTLLLQCLERILGELPTEMRIPALLQNVLQDYTGNYDVRVMVHPDNRASFDDAVARFQSERIASESIRVAVDAGMSIDDCLIYVGPDVLDISTSAIAHEMVSALSLPRPASREIL